MTQNTEQQHASTAYQFEPEKLAALDLALDAVMEQGGPDDRLTVDEVAICVGIWLRGNGYDQAREKDVAIRLRQRGTSSRIIRGRFVLTGVALRTT